MRENNHPEKMSTEALMNLRDELRDKVGPYHSHRSRLQRELTAVEKELDIRIFGTELLY